MHLSVLCLRLRCACAHACCSGLTILDADVNNEREVYHLLQERTKDPEDPLLGYISVGHRRTLLNYHSHVLDLSSTSEKGSYSLQSALEFLRNGDAEPSGDRLT
jgi:hypothetical protein